MHATTLSIELTFGWTNPRESGSGNIFFTVMFHKISFLSRQKFDSAIKTFIEGIFDKAAAKRRRVKFFYFSFYFSLDFDCFDLPAEFRNACECRFGKTSIFVFLTD